MNLIEQLGGYENAKQQYKESLPLVQNGYKSQGLEAIRLALLEYRRQHNIYEVGDDVVLSGENSTPMYKLHERIGKYVYLKRPSGREYEFHIDEIRHATHEEIAAGKRL